jgi:hypothetical protein
VPFCRGHPFGKAFVAILAAAVILAGAGIVQTSKMKKK